MDVTPDCRDSTATGVELFAAEPSPSWAKLLLPQHSAAPFTVTTQVCWYPELISAAAAGRPTTDTGTLA
jgi:hypothetical protein